jgi:hypothetical protein
MFYLCIGETQNRGKGNVETEQVASKLQEALFWYSSGIAVWTWKLGGQSSSTWRCLLHHNPFVSSTVALECTPAAKEATLTEIDTDGDR